MIIFVRHVMQNQLIVSIMATLLIMLPIIGMNLVHKYRWEHWEPFSKKHK